MQIRARKCSSQPVFSSEGHCTFSKANGAKTQRPACAFSSVFEAHCTAHIYTPCFPLATDINLASLPGTPTRHTSHRHLLLDLQIRTHSFKYLHVNPYALLPPHLLGCICFHALVFVIMSSCLHLLRCICLYVLVFVSMRSFLHLPAQMGDLVLWDVQALDALDLQMPAIDALDLHIPAMGTWHPDMPAMNARDVEVLILLGSQTRFRSTDLRIRTNTDSAGG